jgi:hypothetical protein
LKNRLQVHGLPPVIVGRLTIVVNLSLIDGVFQSELSWLQVVHMQYFESLLLLVA